MENQSIKSDYETMIFTFRGKKVMVDSDLAILYYVKTKRLKEQVKRNIARFPEDFMFELTENERLELVANCDRLHSLKHSSVNPWVFTELPAESFGRTTPKTDSTENTNRIQKG